MKSPNRAKRRAMARRDVQRMVNFVLQDKDGKFESWLTLEYGEPGYSKPKAGVIVANWNRISQKTARRLEEAGYELEWCDEWHEHNGKAYRTSSNGYDWEPTLIYDGDCDFLVVGEDDEAIIELRAMHKKTDTPNCVPSRITEEILKSFGYVKEPDETYESGHFHDQNDDPVKLAAALWQKPEVSSVVFRIEEQSMFYIKFESYVKRAEREEGDIAA